jgi:cell division septum initiation protein DivIVA
MYGQADDARHLYSENERLEKENAELKRQISEHLKTIESLNRLIKRMERAGT